MGWDRFDIYGGIGMVIGSYINCFVIGKLIVISLD